MKVRQGLEKERCVKDAGKGPNGPKLQGYAGRLFSQIKPANPLETVNLQDDVQVLHLVYLKQPWKWKIAAVKDDHDCGCHVKFPQAWTKNATPPSPAEKITSFPA